MENEPFPVFTRSQDWFDTKLSKTGDDPLKEWSYNAHKDAIKKSLKACKIRSFTLNLNRRNSMRREKLGKKARDRICSLERQ